MTDETYTPYYVFEAEGARIGLATCLRCGAGIVIEKDTNAVEIHDRWHENALTRHATFAVQNEDHSTFVQFIDGTTTTIAPFPNGEPISSGALEGFLLHVNKGIDPSFETSEGGEAREDHT